MKIIAIIPARWASTRFPGKPLALIEGKPMIVRVIEQTKKCPNISEVIVATDNIAIKDAVESAGGLAVLTSTEHQSGTDRCYEAYTHSNVPANFIINVQGDEPYIDPAQITALCEVLNANVALATLVKKIECADKLHNPNIVKVVRATNGHALYFSRAAVPFLREAKDKNWHLSSDYYQHIGVYAYRTDVLKEICSLKVSPLENTEKLEQLRWLEAGYTIKTAITQIASVGIDTPEDLEEALITFKNFYANR